MRRVRPSPARQIGSLLAIAGLCAAAGCAGRERAEDDAVNTGLAHVDKPDTTPPVEIPEVSQEPPPAAELQRLAQESAASLQALFEQMSQQGGDGAEGGAPIAARPEANAVEASPESEPELPVRTALAEELAGQAEWSGPPGTLAAGHMGPPGPDAAGAMAAQEQDPESAPEIDKLPERPLAERIQETTLLLVDLLRQQSMTAERPVRAYLSLAAMEALWPGALQKVITPRSSDQGGLTAEQSAAVEALREFAGAAAALADAEGNESERLAQIAENLLASRPMRIRAAALCARVTGFGQYVPLSSTRFLHGRNHPVIVYTEVAPFAYREATSSEVAGASGGQPVGSAAMWAVELSQELQIYTEADGLLAWSRPEEAVTEVSRNRRRDFFLVNEVVLPRTLSVGRYRLKVIMRDRTSGAVDETVIPIEVVADPALAAGPRD